MHACVKRRLTNLTYPTSQLGFAYLECAKSSYISFQLGKVIYRQASFGV